MPRSITLAEGDAPSWLRRYGPSPIPPSADYGLSPPTACRDVSLTEPLALRGTRPVVPGGFSFARAIPSHLSLVDAGMPQLSWFALSEGHANLVGDCSSFERLEAVMYIVIRKFNRMRSVAEAARRAESGVGELLRQSPPGSWATMCSMPATGSAGP
jgi:hypothetical protein